MRNISATAREAIVAPDGNGETFLAVLNIRHSNGEFNVVSNNEPITGRSGTKYEAYPFEVILPNDTKSEISSVGLTIDNVDRLLVNMLRGENEPPQLSLKIILASTADDVHPEIQVDDLTLVGVDWNASSITGTLTVDDVLNQRFPSNGESYSPIQFEGLF